MMEEAWIRTYTGRRFRPLGPKGSDISIVDIAHALSLTCRFNGHCREFYSNAEHSVRVAGAVPEWMEMEALLHDAAEAYIFDAARPIKRFVRFRDGDASLYGLSMDDVESQALTEIYNALGFEPVACDRIVKWADLRLLKTEARDLMGDPQDWQSLDKIAPLADTIRPWKQRHAKQAFLHLFVRAARRLLSEEDPRVADSDRLHEQADQASKEILRMAEGEKPEGGE